MLTCPWYSATQKERGEQAKHNILLVVVMSEDRQFFSPTNVQTKEAGGVVDLVRCVCVCVCVCVFVFVCVCVCVCVYVHVSVCMCV